MVGGRGRSLSITIVLEIRIFYLGNSVTTCMAETVGQVAWKCDALGSIPLAADTVLSSR